MSIQKVAKLAGVSSSTVSRVINNRPRVAPETEKAVRHAMDKLGYAPSDRRPGPKPMSRREAKTRIGFFVVGTAGNSMSPGFFDLLQGVTSELSERNCELTYDHIVETAQVKSRLRNQNLDGIILHGAALDPATRGAIRRVPCVWVMGNRNRPSWGDQVMPDVFEIGSMAANYLARLGHKQLGFINLDRDHWALQSCGHAFQSAAVHLEISADMISLKRLSLKDYWQQYNADALDEFIERYTAIKPRPTGLFVADSIQLALIQPALHKHGIKIGPSGVQIVTCNREDPYLMGLDPATRPAVIDVHFEMIGRQGIEQLFWRMDHPKAEARVTRLIEPHLYPPQMPLAHNE